MLTHKQKISLYNPVCTSEHLLPFVHKWGHRSDLPPHIYKMLIKIYNMKQPEQRNYYIMDDVMYYIDQGAIETWSKSIKHGWRKTRGEAQKNCEIV